MSRQKLFSYNNSNQISSFNSNSIQYNSYMQYFHFFFTSCVCFSEPINSLFIYSLIQGKTFIWQIWITFTASLQCRASYIAPVLLSSFGCTNVSKQFMTHAAVGAAGMQAFTRPPPYNIMYRNWGPHAPQIRVYRNSDVPVSPSQNKRQKHCKENTVFTT